MDPDLFVAPEALVELDLICAICQHVLSKPEAILPHQKSHPCQHVFCRSCLREWMTTNGNNTCPNCRAKIQSVIEDVRTMRLLAKQIVRCPRYKDGCVEQGYLGTGNQDFFHIHEKSCGFKPVKCECKEVMLRKDLVEHHQNCVERKVLKCPFSHCGCGIQLNERMMGEHMLTSDREHLILTIRNSEVSMVFQFL
jgi:hypothetical protein